MRDGVTDAYAWVKERDEVCIKLRRTSERFFVRLASKCITVTVHLFPQGDSNTPYNSMTCLISVAHHSHFRTQLSYTRKVCQTQPRSRSFSSSYPFGAPAGPTRALSHADMKPRECVSSTNSAACALLALSKRAAGLGIAQGEAAGLGCLAGSAEPA